MSVKLAFAVAFMMLAAVGLSAADIPNLVGNWTGTFEGYERGLGYVNVNETGASIMTISEQKVRLFTGNFTDKYSSNPDEKGPIIEGFSGVIALDNKTFYLAEYDRGYSIGTITSNDTLELMYIEDGETAEALIDRFQRVE